MCPILLSRGVDNSRYLSVCRIIVWVYLIQVRKIMIMTQLEMLVMKMMIMI